VFVSEEGAHLHAEKKMTATAAHVEEAELDGDRRKGLRRVSSTNSRRPLIQRRRNAAVPSSSSTSSAGLATSNESEWREERLSGSELGVVCVHSFDRRGFL
jgi:hypothetical protein